MTSLLFVYLGVLPLAAGAAFINWRFTFARFLDRRYDRPKGREYNDLPTSATLRSTVLLGVFFGAGGALILVIRFLPKYAIIFIPCLAVIGFAALVVAVVTWLRNSSRNA